MILALNLYAQKKIVIKKNKNKIISFLHNTSNSAIGYNKKIGA